MRYNVRRDPRLAGEITRYHTWPRVREQSVGEHSWQLTRIVLTVWPECPQEVLVYCTFHDVGEMGTGDVPYPLKKNNHQLKVMMDMLEEETYTGMIADWGIPLLPSLTNAQRNVVKTCELLEMIEWAQTEVARGNNLARPVITRCERNVEEIMKGDIALFIRERIDRYIMKMMSRFRTWREADEY